MANPFVVEKGDPNAPGYKQWWDIFRYQAIGRGKPFIHRVTSGAFKA
jgi:hypothetical protein